MPYRDPERRRQAQRESARRRRARERGSLSTRARQPTPSGRGASTAHRARSRLVILWASAVDVADVLADALEHVRADEHAGTLAKARTLAYVAGMRLRAHEVGELAAEVADLRRRVDTRERNPL